jgi:hypothetical protein
MTTPDERAADAADIPFPPFPPSYVCGSGNNLSSLFRAHGCPVRYPGGHTSFDVSEPRA